MAWFSNFFPRNTHKFLDRDYSVNRATRRM